MEIWTCPKCKREFGKVRQSHTCERGLTLDEFFATAQPWERPIFDKVSAHIRDQGVVIIDPIAIGILFKHGPMFAELRSMKKWTAVGFYLGRKLTSSKLSRKVIEYNGKYMHYINVDDVDLIDDEILDWLTEAYHLAGGTSPSSVGADPMVPDDIDDEIY